MEGPDEVLLRRDNAALGALHDGESGGCVGR